MTARSIKSEAAVLRRMEDRPLVLYVGGFRFPSGTASAQRAIENANLLEHCRYSVVLVGKEELGCGEDQDISEISGFTFFNIERPSRRKRFPDYATHIDSIRFVIEESLNGRKPYAIIAYNYPSRSLRKLIRYCRENNIKVIAECTEWYGWEGKRFFRNCKRWYQTQLRMRYLARRAKNVIIASGYLRKFYRKSNVYTLPFVVDIDNAKWRRASYELNAPETARKFVYFGSTGIDCSKDYLHLVIEAFFLLHAKDLPFQFNIIGPSRAELVRSFPFLDDLLVQLSEKVRFMGRLTHLETLNEVKVADFMVLLRPDNRTSNVGFPTKVVESISCGVPVISNATSDIKQYILHGVNGLIVDGATREALRGSLEMAISFDRQKMEGMVNACVRDNPFDATKFQSEFSQYMASLR